MSPAGTDPGAVVWAGVPGWIGALGRLRDVVRQEVLASQLASLPCCTSSTCAKTYSQ